MSEENQEEGWRELFEKQANEQFSALGKFVQTFELMVQDIRYLIIKLSEVPEEQFDALKIILHHRNLTAQPLFEICDAMAGAAMLRHETPKLKPHFDVARQVMKQIRTDWQALARQRNTLLHTTWWIGSVFEEQEYLSQILSEKFTPSKDGLKRIATPENIEEIEAITDKCESVSNLLNVIFSYIALPDHHKLIASKFEKIIDPKTSKAVWVAKI